MNSLNNAETVIAMTAFKSKALLDVADVLLPISIYAENEGTYFNITGTPQQFSACVPSQGESRPGWKVLRVLTDGLGVEGADYENITDVQDELTILLQGIRPEQAKAGTRPDAIVSGNGGIGRIGELPMNSVDSLVRNAAALQQTQDISDGLVHINSKFAVKLSLSDGDQISITQGEETARLGYLIDERVPDNTVLIYAAHPNVVALGPWFSEVSIEKG